MLKRFYLSFQVIKVFFFSWELKSMMNIREFSLCTETREKLSLKEGKWKKPSILFWRKISHEFDRFPASPNSHTKQRQNCHQKSNAISWARWKKFMTQKYPFSWYWIWTWIDIVKNYSETNLPETPPVMNTNLNRTNNVGKKKLLLQALKQSQSRLKPSRSTLQRGR